MEPSRFFCTRRPSGARLTLAFRGECNSHNATSHGLHCCQEDQSWLPIRKFSGKYAELQKSLLLCGIFYALNSLILRVSTKKNQQQYAMEFRGRPAMTPSGLVFFCSLLLLLRSLLLGEVFTVAMGREAGAGWLSMLDPAAQGLAESSQAGSSSSGVGWVLSALDPAAQELTDSHAGPTSSPRCGVRDPFSHLHLPPAASTPPSPAFLESRKEPLLICVVLASYVELSVFVRLHPLTRFPACHKVPIALVNFSWLPSRTVF